MNDRHYCKWAQIRPHCIGSVWHSNLSFCFPTRIFCCKFYLIRRSEKRWSPHFRLRHDNHITALSIKDILVCFLNALHGMWNLTSLTRARDWTPLPAVEVWSDLQGSPISAFSGLFAVSLQLWLYCENWFTVLYMCFPPKEQKWIIIMVSTIELLWAFWVVKGRSQLCRECYSGSLPSSISNQTIIW